MRKLSVTFGSSKDSIVVGYHVAISRPNGTGKETYIKSDDEKTERVFMLEPNESITIKAVDAPQEMVYDREQNAAVTKEAFESKRSEEENQQIEKDRQAEVKETEAWNETVETKARQAGELAAQRAREDLAAKQQLGKPSQTSHGKETAKTEPNASGARTPPVAETKVGDPKPGTPAAKDAAAKPHSGTSTAELK